MLQIRTTFATSLTKAAQPAATSSATPAPASTPALTQTRYQFGNSLERLGTFGLNPQPALGKPRLEALPALNAIANKVNEAKALANQADQLRRSDLPGDRLRAYEIMREVGEKLKDVNPSAAMYFQRAATMHLNNDQKVKQYQDLLAAGIPQGQADAAASTPNFWTNTGGYDVRAFFAIGLDALKRM